MENGGLPTNQNVNERYAFFKMVKATNQNKKKVFY